MLLLIIDHTEVSEVNGAVHGGNRGVWINTNQVNVFVPFSVLSMCSDMENTEVVSDESAKKYFMELLDQCSKKRIFLTSSDYAFIVGCRDRVNRVIKGNYSFSAKQKAWLKLLHEKYISSKKTDDIPF